MHDELVSNLKKRGFEPYFVESGKDAVELICNLIGENSFVAFGGSQTVREIGLHNALNSKGRLIKHTDFPENMAVRYTGEGEKWFVSSTNALTRGGELINIDGNANRISGMIYNNPNVVVVTGINKLVDDIESGIDRVRNVAAPPNAVRLNRNTPCKTTGKCSYCYSPDCMCNATLIQHHPTRGVRFVVVIVNESLGY